MSKKKCNCNSTNMGMGTEENVVLENPFGTKKVCLDACIAKVIQHLWKNNIGTGGSCCGHNKRKPNIVLTNTNLGREYVDRVLNTIKEIDDRELK